MPKALVGNDRYRLRPVHRGTLFCSPWCGCKCTWAANRLAWKRGRALRARMGKGWTVRVWENGGWHNEVISPCRRIRVSENRYKLHPRTFDAYIGEKDDVGIKWSANASTPERAVALAVASAKRELAKINAAFLDL